MPPWDLSSWTTKPALQQPVYDDPRELPYEQALTRKAIGRNDWYNLGTHYPWIGDRTRDINGAHVEYFRGIKNPIGLKVGPTATPAGLIELLDHLNPATKLAE